MEMKRVSVEPDDITFIGVLNGCGHVGLMGSCGPNARGLKQPGRPSGAVAIYRMVSGCPLWSSPDYHLVPEDKRERTPPGMPWACTDDYIPWLMVFSHPRVGRGQAPVGLRVRQGREEQVRVVLDVVHRALGDPKLGAVELQQALQDVEAIFRPTFVT
ncbi:hypothetical protein RHMOL_Rhmol03G0096300 [Rhododendron molle]|uniref:Uncharacterized protein n=1 Tax=Rhododendron molle TaxID=49168 RepID=A0ACC0PEU6_RHOML|nr:hypothetical protein RHMOL_Rhmol03G0096300 [Rhododendron molle]